jgi:hypothetical protein
MPSRTIQPGRSTISAVVIAFFANPLSDVGRAMQETNALSFELAEIPNYIDINDGDFLNI